MFRVRELAVHLQKRDMFFVWVHSEVSHRYITLLWGPLVLFQNLTLKFPQLSCSFASTTHRCLRALQRVGVGTAMVSWFEQQRLSRRVCPEIKEGRTQTQIPADELPWQLRLSQCEGCWTTGACRLANDGGWVCPGISPLPLRDLKWEEWQFISGRMSNRTTDPWAWYQDSQLPTHWPWSRQNSSLSLHVFL